MAGPRNMLWTCQGIVVLVVVLMRDCQCQQLISKTQRARFDFDHENFMRDLNRSFLRHVSRRLQNCELEQ